MEKEFLNFIANIMDLDVSEINLDSRYGEIEAWDSMMHIRLVMEIENEYNIDIPIDEVPDIDTLKKFYAYIVKG